jgi:hypothetical protein
VEEQQYQRLQGFGIDISGHEQMLRMETSNRFEAIVAQVRHLKRELELRPLPRMIPTAIDSEAGGTPPGAS